MFSDHTGIKLEINRNVLKICRYLAGINQPSIEETKRDMRKYFELIENENIMY